MLCQEGFKDFQLSNQHQLTTSVTCNNWVIAESIQHLLSTYSYQLLVIQKQGLASDTPAVSRGGDKWQVIINKCCECCSRSQQTKYKWLTEENGMNWPRRAVQGKQLERISWWEMTLGFGYLRMQTRLPGLFKWCASGQDPAQCKKHKAPSFNPWLWKVP